MSAQSRVNVLKGHLQSQTKLDAEKLADFLDDNRPLRKLVHDHFLRHPELLSQMSEGMTKEEHRDMVRRQLRSMVLDLGLRPLTLYSTDTKKYFYLGELASAIDLSLMIKFGVQYSLWGGSVLNLGTEKHRKRFAEDIDAFRLPGCFAMTELQHGSNVAGLKTEAVLDLTSDEWVITTPDDGAIKWWIGNAAEDGRMATVFARLLLPDVSREGRTLVDKGVHAFVVPIRDAVGNLVPGVEIRDCGYKVGLNGIDNGAIRFTNVRIPRANLLDRFGSVNSRGEYESEMSETKRFGATLGELTSGRVGLVAGSLGVLKVALTIAIRYGAMRRQFGPPGEEEICILDYTSHQRKLLPLLASAYALHFAKEHLVDKYVALRKEMASGGHKDDDAVQDVHALSAGLKAYVTWYTSAALNTCRESCGGHGFAAVNRLGALRSDHDIFTTFEGDNTVLLQQVASFLLKQYQKKFSGGPVIATFRYLSEVVSDALPVNPLTSHDAEPRHVREPAFLQRAMNHRVERLLHTAAARLREHAASKGQFEAWNQCLPHLLALATAHIEAVTLECSLRAVERCADPESKHALRLCTELFALQRIHGDVNLRDDDYLAPPKAKAINRLIGQICAELRPLATTLVDAFDIPDFILRAPIGLHQEQGQVGVYDSYLRELGWGDSMGSQAQGHLLKLLNR